MELRDIELTGRRKGGLKHSDRPALIKACVVMFTFDTKADWGFRLKRLEVQSVEEVAWDELAIGQWDHLGGPRLRAGFNKIKRRIPGHETLSLKGQYQGLTGTKDF